MSHAKSLDLEATEFFVRSSMHKAGARVLEEVLNEIGRGSLGEPPVCTHNHRPARMKSLGLKKKTLRTILGQAAFRRSAYQCPICGRIEYPADKLLGVLGTRFSPGARRMMARQGADDCFREGAENLEFFANLRVDAKDVERKAESVGRVVDDWMREQASLATLITPDDTPETLYVEFDGTGVPVRKKELSQSKGKGPDGKARTREVKLGCVFTQTTLDKNGKPQRDPDGTTYVGAIEPSVDFGCRIKAEAVRRGLLKAQRVVVLTDGEDNGSDVQYADVLLASHEANRPVFTVAVGLAGGRQRRSRYASFQAYRRDASYSAVLQDRLAELSRVPGAHLVT